MGAKGVFQRKVHEWTHEHCMHGRNLGNLYRSYYCNSWYLTTELQYMQTPEISCLLDVHSWCKVFHCISMASLSDYALSLYYLLVHIKFVFFVFITVYWLCMHACMMSKSMF